MKFNQFPKQQMLQKKDIKNQIAAHLQHVDVYGLSLDELRQAYINLQQLIAQCNPHTDEPNTDASSYYTKSSHPVNVDSYVTENAGKAIFPLQINNGETSSLVYFNRDMVCEFANQEFNKWLPTGITNPVGHHHKELVGDEIFDIVLPHLHQVLQGKQTQFERNGKVAGGEDGWVRVQYIPVEKDNKVIGYYTIVTPITAIKDALAQLRFEHDKTLALINNCRDYIYSFNPDLKLITANSAYKLFFKEVAGIAIAPGISILPVIDDDSYDYAHYVEMSLKNYKRALAGEEFVAETNLVFKEKGIEVFFETSFYPIIKNGKVEAVACCARDITQRKKEIERLKLLESVITNTKDMVMVTRAEPLNEPGPIIEYVNPAFTAITGYTAEEAIGQSPRFLQGPASDRQQLKKLRKCMGKWQPCEVTTINYKKNGDEFWINFSVHPVANEKGWFTHWVSVERDVTKQKITELAVIENLRQLENYKQAVEMGTNLFIFDMSGIITFANQQFCQLSKYSLQELVGSHISILDTEQQGDDYYSNFWATIQAGSVFKGQIKKKAKDGTFFWVDVTKTPFFDTGGRVYQVLAIDNNITQAKQAEEALTLNIERFDYAAKATLDVIWDWDIFKGEIYYSDACKTLMGYRPGIHPFKLEHKYFINTHKDDVDATIASLQSALDSGATHWQYQNRVMKSDGQCLTISDRGIIIRNKEGVAVRMVGAMQDVTARVNFELALQQTNRTLADYKLAVDEASMVFICGVDGIIRYANDKLCQVSKHTQQELIGQHISIFKSGYHHPDVYAGFWQTVKAGKVFKGQLKNRAKNGGIYWIDTTVTPFLNSKGEVYQLLAIETDITENKMAEEALLESNNRFNYAVQATFDVIWDWDIVTGKMFLSDAYETNFGYEAGWHTFALAPEYFNKKHPDDLFAVMASLQAAIKNGDSFWQQQYRLLKLNGQYAHITDRAVIIRNENGEAIRMVGAKRDITAEVEAAEKERERENYFREMVYNVDDVINIIDENGFVLYSSPSIKAVLGFTPEEVVGLKTFALAHPDDYDHLKMAFTALLQKPGNGGVFECRYRHKNGHYVNIEIQGNSQLNNPAIKGVVLTTRDITARKQKEEERRELMYELMMKNTDLRQFSYLAGHNLRAPLTNLTAICNLLDVDTLDPGEIPMFIKAFQLSASKLNSVLDDIIEILLIKDNTNQNVKKPVSLHVALEAAQLKLKSAIAAKKATITANFTNAWCVMFNQKYLEEIFVELITNALQFSHNHRPPVINFAARAEGNNVFITVGDNGIGMDMLKTKNKIFGLYQRFHNIGNGKGLGLYMVQAKLNAFSYTLTAESVVNGGSVFTLRLAAPPAGNL